ncbi:MAG: RagB/SusD family nutrient uptake outer membrane protein [Bacteroidota bacterium]
MKLVNKLLFAAAALSVGAFSSCKKFIKEELVTTLTEDYYKTDQGLEDLVKSAYVPLKWKYEGEQAYGMYNFGVDEFRNGDQFNFVHYGIYNAALNSSDGLTNGLWTTMYAGIHRCNLGIKNITAFSNPASALLGTDAKKNARIGELKALRAFYYFQLVQQLGGVPLLTEPVTELRTEFPRASVAEVYNQIISDLRTAGPALAWRATGEVGRATKAMAYHFLARAYLTRGSAVTDARGQKPTDMDSCIVYADSVIRFSGHALEADYGNLFSASYASHGIPRAGTDGVAPLGDKSKITANNNSNEIIFAAQFSDNIALASAANNQVHLFFNGQYDAGMPGMVRDFFNGRPFRRLRPTDYAIDVYDKVNDSRFFKSFQTVYYRNVASNAGLPVFTALNAPTPDVVGKPRVGIGDTAALFILNTPANPVLATDIANMRYYSVFARYKKATPTSPVVSDFTSNKYLTLTKHLDGVRLTNTNNEARGIRNGMLARLGETYLILAEAYGRKGDYTSALLNVNVLRKRAAYKASETRSPQVWQYLGGANSLGNTETGNTAISDLFTTNAPGELYPATVTTTPQRFIHFMLNERVRELCGELYRWEDLVRTETLFDRTKLFNADVDAGFKPSHKLRPIPLLQMIAQTTNGKPMTAAEMAAYQNPGY